MSEIGLDEMDYWRLCDELTVIQAALLVVGADPAGNQEWVLTQEAPNRPRGFDAAFAALKNSIGSKTLKATIRRSSWERGWNELPDEDHGMATDSRRQEIIYEAFPDWNLSTLGVGDLKDWLRKRGLRSGFFFPNETDEPDYLDPGNPRFASKLACAVRAWQAVTNPGGKSPKQALVKWLREHAAEFDLTDDEGKPNETGIEEVAKVANWQRSGGAPKTPGD
ncbi:MAG: hypothetical protein NVS9B10_05980 [Nevskia sp.]